MTCRISTMATELITADAVIAQIGASPIPAGTGNKANMMMLAGRVKMLQSRIYALVPGILRDMKWLSRRLTKADIKVVEKAKINQSADIGRFPF
jgi:hypothetical protein